MIRLVSRAAAIAVVALAAVTALAATSGTALAHDGRPLAPHDLWAAWELNPAVTAPLLISGALYWVGLHRLWARSARGRGVRVWEATCFGAGWLALAVALVSPLHALGGVLFSAHMTQHELLMVVAAPLLVLGRPFVAFLWAVPPRWRRRIGAWGRSRWVRACWRSLMVPAVAWSVHAAALALWHVPALYETTYRSGAAHALQHLTFFATAIVFWWALLRPVRGGEGESVIYLFAATLFTGALGALLAFARDLWYPHYAATTGAWGVTPLDDQQLGGVIMWVPGGASYLLAALALFASWLRESDRRAQHRGRLTVAHADAGTAG